MLPISTIVIKKGGNSKIIGEEKSPNCYELTNMGKAAGKVTESKDKDHTPVHQSVHNGRR